MCRRSDVVGCQRPPEELPHPAIRFHGRLDKRCPEQRALLQQLYAQAHFLTMPTRAEAFGVVFAEAAAHGLPSIALRTGGVPSVVKHGETGWLLDPACTAADLAGAIRRIAGDPALYHRLSEGALADAAGRLNWDHWGQQVARAVHTRREGAAG